MKAPAEPRTFSIPGIHSIWPAPLVAVFTMFLLAGGASPGGASLQAAVTNVVWYRLGENDPGVSGQTATSTAIDLVGGRNLRRIGSPRYTNNVSPAAQQMGSSLAVLFSGNQLYSNTVPISARDNFGIEAFVRTLGVANGTYLIAHAGNPAANGWGLQATVTNNILLGRTVTYSGELGGGVRIGTGGLRAPDAWAHVALVRNNGTSTFYLNGLSSGSTSTTTPVAPSGGFIIDAPTGLPGIIDEVRVFTFAPGQFNVGDLLVNQKRVTTLPASGLAPAAATLNGRASLFSLPATTVWFEFGTTTNYGNLTAPLALAGPSNTVTFGILVTNLFTPGQTHFRTVASNQLGVAFGLDQSFETPGPAFPDLVLPSGVIVTIEPPEAVADGARWTLDGGLPQLSGAVHPPVAPGEHTIRFIDLPNWRESQPLEVFVVGGKTTQVSVAFSRLPVFDFRDVPEQHARASEPVEFFVTGASNAVLQTAATPPPAGTITFDPATGRFAYAPKAADRLPFSLSFLTGGVQAASTLITPLPTLPNEEITLNYDRSLPDEESRDYITISEKLNDAETFNDKTNQTITVDISGKTLVFDVNHPGNLHRQYNGRDNLKEFRLFADRVIIRSPLLLPQTHVSIHARELRFEGDGVIDTTPQARRFKPAGVLPEDERTAGIDGDPGHNGGDAEVFLERFHADPTPATRFILRGGAGGAAGEGRNGVPETAFLACNDPSNTNCAGWLRLMARAGNKICGTGGNSFFLYLENRSQTGTVIKTNSVCGARVSARGEPAVRSGLPGAGGRGGRLRSTLNLKPYAEQTGGVAGAKGGDYTGGTLLNHFAWRIFTIRTVNNVTTFVNDDTPAPALPGDNGPAPIGVDGAAGSVEILPDPSSWLHSFSVRGLVQFAKDAYLDGHNDEARRLLSEYRDYLRALQPTVAAGSVTNLTDEEFAETTSLDQLTLEAGTLIHRIDSNLDFFGNPAGFAPMLSFEANLIAFQREIDQSIPILYLAYWLNYSATNFQSSLEASTVAAGKLRSELADMIAAFNEAQVAIPRLKVEADVIQGRIFALRATLSLLEKALLARAEQNVEDRHKVPFWKKGLALLSVVADLVPVGQPALGRVGAGLGLLTQIDPDDPVQSALKLTNVFTTIKNSEVSVCFGSASTNAGPASTNAPGVNPESAAAAKKKELKFTTECAKLLDSEFKKIASVFKDVQVDKKEVAAELEKLKASDPVFLQTTAELEKVNKDKERFAKELAAALQAVAKLTSSVTENNLAIHTLESRIAAAAEALDHNALLHIKEMERRAKDRLLTFQYFVAKSFEYRLLRPYSGNLHLNRLFDRFQQIVAGPDAHVLSAAEFTNLKSLYIAELRDTASRIQSTLNANAPERSLPARFDLQPAEIEQLNREGRLTINLRDKGFFGNGLENIRIVDLRTSQLNVRPLGGSVSGFALLFVNFVHQGVSRLTSGGQTVLFRHNQTETVNPITWNTLFDGVANTVVNSLPSPAAESLLRALLDQPNNETLLLFSRPAADAELLITKQVSTANGIDLHIDSLQVEVQYEFFNSTPSRSELTVNVSENLQPVITLNQPDLNGRRDGQGEFQRIFAFGSAVTLQAPVSYGGRPFDRWIINRQPRAPGVATVTLNMTAPITAEASFASTSTTNLAPIITLQPRDATVTLPGSATFTVTASGAPPLTFQWQKNGDPLLDGGRIFGAATPTLVITNLDLSDSAAYSVIVSNAFGFVSSQAAVLTTIAPSVLLLPAGATNVGFQFSTEVGRRYLIERTFGLDAPDWQVVQTLDGAGTPMQFTRPTLAPTAFFRLRIE